MMTYDDLCSFSANISHGILQKSLRMETPKNKAQIDYIVDQCELIHASYDPVPVSDSSASARLLQVLYNDFELLVAGATGEQILKRHKGLWADTNKNWLMGNFADAVSEYIRAQDINGFALELGAGVGATSDKISHKFDKYFRSDLMKFRPNDVIINFDYPISYLNLGYEWIIATNALHCSKDKVNALNNISGAMRVNSKLVLAEGHPTPGGKPFALNNAYGLFDGWWNVGGFLDEIEWVEAFTKADLMLSDLIPVKSDDTIIGYVYVVEKRR